MSQRRKRIQSVTIIQEDEHYEVGSIVIRKGATEDFDRIPDNSVSFRLSDSDDDSNEDVVIYRQGSQTQQSEEGSCDSPSASMEASDYPLGEVFFRDYETDEEQEQSEEQVVFVEDAEAVSLSNKKWCTAFNMW